jgi:hypothetical protein
VRKIAFILTSTVVAATLAGTAGAGVSSSAVKATAANEQSPAASTNWFAWTQSPADHPNRTNVWAEATPINGTDAFRVNPMGTRAWTGGIEGNELVYQELASGDSDIERYNLATQQPIADAPINTDKWEWHPSISTDSAGDRWIVFGRQNTSTSAQKILAYNVTDDVMSELQATTRSRYFLIPGQVNGNWATWTACLPNCHVRYVNLITGNRSTVPRPDSVRNQYASSVAEDGTIYYVRSGSGCGANVRIMRFDSGTSRRMVDLADNRDIFFTYASDEGPNTRVYYDRVACGSGAWNIYRFVD